MPEADAFRAYEGALTFIDECLMPPDMVALMTFQSGVVRLLQDFTNDTGRLKEVILTLMDRVDEGNLGSAFGQNDAAFNVFNTNRQLSALQTAVMMFTAYVPQITLIYFGSSLALNATQNQAQFQATVNAAVRANVTVNPVDTRGLVALLPIGDASRPSPGGVGLYSGELAVTQLRHFQGSQDTLYALAEDTGGRAVIDENDLSRGIVEVTRRVTSYYILAYYSSHTARDGRIRRVRIKLTGAERDAKLSYRSAYYGVRDYLDFTDADKERQLEEALMASNPATDLTLGLEVHYFRLNSAEYFVSVFITIPGSELEPGGRGRAHVMLDLIGEVRTVYGATIQNLRDKVDIQLTDEKADRLPTRPIHYETGFTLLPDEYAIKVLARDATTGRIGTYETRFTVPNLKSEDQLVPLSSVVLSHSQVALGDEWHRVDQDPGTDEVHPLVHDNRKLIPSVTRVFGQKNDLRVLLEAYQLASQTTDGPLVAYVGLYREDTKVLETPPLLATNGRTHRPWAVPLRFRVPLQAVPPGRYRCQVTVLDPQGQKVVFWHAPVVVTP